MKLTIKLNGEVITRDVNAYVIHRELSQYIGEGKKMCEHCSHLMTCDHNSVDNPSIKRAVKVGDKEALVTECDEFSPVSSNFVPGRGLPDKLIPSEEIRYGDVFTASIPHPVVSEFVKHMR